MIFWMCIIMMILYFFKDVCDHYDDLDVYIKC